MFFTCLTLVLLWSFPNEALTSLDSSIPGQAAMRLDTGHKDWQLPALAAPPPCDSHAQRLMGFLLHSDVFLLTGHTLGKVLDIIIQRQHAHKHSFSLCVYSQVNVPLSIIVLSLKLIFTINYQDFSREKIDFNWISS